MEGRGRDQLLTGFRVAVVAAASSDISKFSSRQYYRQDVKCESSGWTKHGTRTRMGSFVEGLRVVVVAYTKKDIAIVSTIQDNVESVKCESSKWQNC